MRRYEREAHCGHRSTVKRILEQEVPGSRMMVLRICATQHNQATPAAGAELCKLQPVRNGALYSHGSVMFYAHWPMESTASAGALLSSHVSDHLQLQKLLPVWAVHSCMAGCIRVVRLDPSAPAVQGMRKLGGSQMHAPAQQTLLLLTDGWYCIRAALDGPLTRLQASGRLQPGKF